MAKAMYFFLKKRHLIENMVTASEGESMSSITESKAVGRQIWFWINI